MRKAYIQPEIELLTVSALEDFLIGSPDEDTSIETGNGAGDGWNGNDNEVLGGDDEWA